MFTKLRKELRNTSQYLGHSFRLMIGIPNYEAYVQHMKTTHPGQPIMSYEAFFRDRQNVRYGAGATKCC